MSGGYNSAYDNGSLVLKIKHGNIFCHHFLSLKEELCYHHHYLLGDDMLKEL